MRLIKLLVIFLLMSLPVHAEVLVDENFDDQGVTAPLSLYCTYGDAAYSNTVYRGASGYSVVQDHYQGDTMAILGSVGDALSVGMYFRYWVYYPDSYTWPGEESAFDNVKLLKIAGDEGWDVEFIYKASDNQLKDYCPTAMQLYWIKESTGECCGGTGTGTATLFSGGTDYGGNDYLTKDAWHKIEGYIQIPSEGNSIVHMQIDDVDVYENTNADIRKPASSYGSTSQMVSIRGSNAPPEGHGTWYFDDMYIASGDGDLCDTEEDPPVSSARSTASGTAGWR